jgi:hypothetical protein
VCTPDSAGRELYFVPAAASYISPSTELWIMALAAHSSSPAATKCTTRNTTVAEGSRVCVCTRDFGGRELYSVPAAASDTSPSSDGIHGSCGCVDSESSDSHCLMKRRICPLSSVHHTDPSDCIRFISMHRGPTTPVPIDGVVSRSRLSRCSRPYAD